MYQFADYSEVVSPDPIYYIVSANPKQAEVILLKYGMPVPTVDMESPEMALYNSAVRLIEAHPETEDEFYEIHPDKQRMGKSCYSCGEKHMKVSNYCSSGCETNHSDYTQQELKQLLGGVSDNTGNTGIGGGIISEEIRKEADSLKEKESNDSSLKKTNFSWKEMKPSEKFLAGIIVVVFVGLTIKIIK
tara:strand:+ start:15559 stop:16125 length:567 start_codon:yes stop_codon:yes gene_type:complete